MDVMYNLINKRSEVLRIISVGGEKQYPVYCDKYRNSRCSYKNYFIPAYGCFTKHEYTIPREMDFTLFKKCIVQKTCNNRLYNIYLTNY